MQILMVATKSPWPPIDGGRLVLLNTIDALSAAGHEVSLVVPTDPQLPHVGIVRQTLEERCNPHIVPAKRRGFVSALVRSQLTRSPVTIVRHNLAAVRQMVERLLETHAYDVVHVEQQQAVAAAEPARRAGIPMVLRAQNVESLLWTFASGYRQSAVRWAFNREARRLAAWEGRCVRAASATVALTPVDARHLQRLAGSKARVEVVEAPFRSEMKPGPRQPVGRPAVAVLASGTWIPNRDAIWRFVAETWPKILDRIPDGRLHVFGIDEPADHASSVTWHAPPENSETAFPEDAIFAVPARHPTGVPMKCLEAWARGLPVVGSAEAAEQLDAANGEQMVVASSPEEFAEGTAALFEDPGLQRKVAAGGRTALSERYSPEHCAERLEEIYNHAIAEL